ncbi:MAG: ABC transporter ATP-binding protein, partial [Planctomycetaceae bacterium]|nr:ABC transporter ATP-binding protein [Planctomycetaceae bacterium]
LQRINMLLDMVGLSAVAYRRIGEYSKGMKRLIGMAQALINDPDLLILDEPTSGLDPNATRHFKDLVRILVDRGKTVVLSSHMLADVEDVCDRVCVLYGGRVRAMGAVGDLLTQTSLTQITTDQLDQPTLDAVRAVLQRNGRDIKEVAAPRDRLESVFLKIVADAQAGNVKTGGAAPTGGVAEFLRQPDREPLDGRAVIEDLLTAAQPAPAQEAPVAAPPVPQPQRDVLDSLVAPAPAAAPPPVPRQDKPAPVVQADRDVLNQLLGGTDGRKDQGEA